MPHTEGVDEKECVCQTGHLTESEKGLLLVACCFAVSFVLFFSVFCFFLSLLCAF